MMLQETSQHSELLWLAYLITGNRELSVDAVVNAADFDANNPFFRNWMISWSRKLVIARALADVERDMAASLERTRRLRHPRLQGFPSPQWSLDSHRDKAELERAMLAIDLFPRCALVLRVFERVSLEDTATLLGAGKDEVKRGQAIGLAEMVRNLASGRAVKEKWMGCPLLCMAH